MKKIINILENISIWYGVAIIFLYGLLLAEFFSTINHFMSIDNSDTNIFIVVSRISYFVIIISGIIVWIISTFLFHLTALLFNGHAQFKRFLFVSSYPYIIPLIMILISMIILDNIQIPNPEDVVLFLSHNSTFKWALNLINCSFVLYYILVTILIHNLYKIKYLYAVLSIVIPAASIWLVTELFKFA